MMDSPIRLNHLGFLCRSPKTFIYLGTGEEKFTVDRLWDLRLEKVYEGTLAKCPGDELAKGYAGDFSALTEPGIYRINCGGINSRCFIIYDKVYDTATRVLLNYITWQRCGSNKGWNGACHLDDEITMEDGLLKRLAGGHHQSCDTRKWAWGNTLAAIGLLKYALTPVPQWDSGEIEGEVRWNCDYFRSLMHEDGYLLDCTFLPDGWKADGGAQYPGFGDDTAIWKKRRFYLKPAPAPAHWNAIRMFALAARYYKASDTDYAVKCLVSAKKIWRYMTGTADRSKRYALPEYPPLGHDGMHKIFQGFFKDSALDIAGLLNAAMDLYLATGDECYAQAAQNAATKLCALQADGPAADNLAAACFWEAEGSSRVANNYFYFYNTYIPNGLADAAALFPAHAENRLWLEAVKKIADQYALTCAHNPFGRLPGTWAAAGEDVFGSAAFFSFSTNEAELKDDSYAGQIRKKTGEELPVHYRYFSFCYNLDLIAGAVFLIKAHTAFGDDRYHTAAMRQIDWLLGMNPYDASSIEGVGYNQPHRGIFGEFFPPVPQIPGAVFTGLTAESFNPKSYGYDCEYDMPMVTWLMYLFAFSAGTYTAASD